MVANISDPALPQTVRVAHELCELVPRFLVHRRADVERLAEALERADFETVRNIGHAMKGAGGGYGFDEITMIGAALETLARAGDAAGTAAEVRRLREFLDRVRVVFD